MKGRLLGLREVCLENAYWMRDKEQILQLLEDLMFVRLWEI